MLAPRNLTPTNAVLSLTMNLNRTKTFIRCYEISTRVGLRSLRTPGGLDLWNIPCSALLTDAGRTPKYSVFLERIDDHLCNLQVRLAFTLIKFDRLGSIVPREQNLQSRKQWLGHFLDTILRQSLLLLPFYEVGSKKLKSLRRWTNNDAKPTAILEYDRPNQRNPSPTPQVGQKRVTGGGRLRPTFSREPWRRPAGAQPRRPPRPLFVNPGGTSMRHNSHRHGCRCRRQAAEGKAVLQPHRSSGRP
jgi:hypothetical protein